MTMFRPLKKSCLNSFNGHRLKHSKGLKKNNDHIDGGGWYRQQNDDSTNQRVMEADQTVRIDTDKC